MNYDLATFEARKAIAAKYGQAHGLDPALVAAVCEQESGWNPYAVRFEPLFLARYIKPLLPGAPSTSEITRACSFGLMQVMGQVAIEHGWQGKFLTELIDPETGVEFGCRKLKQCLDRRDGLVPDALQYYNGGGNPNYASQVMARKAKYL
jgi:soluble lytic murein transglycosylase-like protein